MNQIVKLGRFISLILRHQPEIINISLDEHGWANVDKLLLGINDSGRYIDYDMLDEIVRTNNKQRFQYNEDHSQIRASQGHSINVDVQLLEKAPPDFLYHGTTLASLEKIKELGIKRMQRLHVHLSKDIETALKVGSRHGKPIVLVIDAKAMSQAGIKFYYSNNGVWLCDSVPYKYVVGML